jgi:hypothetical protein
VAKGVFWLKGGGTKSCNLEGSGFV